MTNNTNNDGNKAEYVSVSIRLLNMSKNVQVLKTDEAIFMEFYNYINNYLSRQHNLKPQDYLYSVFLAAAGKVIKMHNDAQVMSKTSSTAIKDAAHTENSIQMARSMKRLQNTIDKLDEALL